MYHLESAGNAVSVELMLGTIGEICMTASLIFLKSCVKQYLLVPGFKIGLIGVLFGD